MSDFALTVQYFDNRKTELHRGSMHTDGHRPVTQSCRLLTDNSVIQCWLSDVVVTGGWRLGVHVTDFWPASAVHLRDRDTGRHPVYSHERATHLHRLRPAGVQAPSRARTMLQREQRPSTMLRRSASIELLNAPKTTRQDMTTQRICLRNHVKPLYKLYKQSNSRNIRNTFFCERVISVKGGNKLPPRTFRVSSVFLAPISVIL